VRYYATIWRSVGLTRKTISLGTLSSSLFDATANMSSTRGPTRQGKRRRSDRKQPTQDPRPDSGFQGPSGTQPKVAIPRIQQGDLVPANQKGRIKHACVACQQQKARCSGEQPQCQRCSDLDLECNYTMGKRAVDRQYARLVSVIIAPAKF
jgi:hypothetical protein